MFQGSYTKTEVERLRELADLEAQIRTTPAKLQRGTDTTYETQSRGSGLMFQKCGGGRRVIRKKIEGD